MALALQQAHELLLPAYRRGTQQPDDGGATRLSMMVGLHKEREWCIKMHKPSMSRA
jgi:hypothetical protein